MDHPRTARTAARAVTTAAALAALTLSTACGAAGGGQRTEPDPQAEAAAELKTAQLVQFGDAKIVPERSEQGSYARLDTIRQAEKVRDATKLNKPECADASNRWGRLPEVRRAAASLATFAQGDDTITHTLLQVPERTAEKAVDSAEPATACDSYTATITGQNAKKPQKSEYSVRKLDVPKIGDASHAMAVETETGGKSVLLYTLTYRHGDSLASTSVMGPATKERTKDRRTTLAEFSEAAMEREKKIL